MQLKEASTSKDGLEEVGFIKMVAVIEQEDTTEKEREQKEWTAFV